jgi:hypothetical protein
VTVTMSELGVSLLGCLAVTALIHSGTGLIDDANNRPIAVRYQHHQES